MLEQLNELLEMQYALDEAILKEHGNVYDEKIAEQMKIALFVELGELMNELPSYFKHWKKTAKDNKEKALVEYVDALHFALSLFNYRKYGLWAIRDYDDEYNKELLNGVNTLFGMIGLIVRFEKEEDFAFVLNCLFDIGNYIGFTWDEIYKAYKDKNTVNYERLKSGY